MRYTNWDFRRRVPTYAKFNPNQPRGDNGRWISNGAAADAAGSIEKAAALFKGVSKPDQQAKLVKFLQEKGMSEADAKKAQDLALSGGGAPAAGGATDGKKPAGDTKPAGGDEKVYNAGTDKEYREYQSKIAGRAGVMPTDVAAVEDANFGFGAKSSHGPDHERVQGLAEETGLGPHEVVRVLKGLEDRQAAAAKPAAAKTGTTAAKPAAVKPAAAKPAAPAAAAHTGPVEMPKGNLGRALKLADVKAPGLPNGVKLDSTERRNIDSRIRELSLQNAPDEGKMRSLADLRDGKPLTPAQHASVIADCQNRYNALNTTGRDMKSTGPQSKIVDSVLGKLGTDAHTNFKSNFAGQKAASLPPVHDPNRGKAAAGAGGAPATAAGGAGASGGGDGKPVASGAPDPGDRGDSHAGAIKSAADDLTPEMHRIAKEARAEAIPDDPEDNHMVDPMAQDFAAKKLAEEYVYQNAAKLGVDLDAETDDRRLEVEGKVKDALLARFRAEDKPPEIGKKTPVVGGGGDARLPEEPSDPYAREFMRDFEGRHGVGWSDIAQQPSAMKAATDSLLDDPGIGWADHFEKNGLTTRDQKRASILEAAKQNPSVQVELLQHLEGVQEATGKTHIKPAPKPKPDGPQFKTMDLFGGDSGGAPAPAAGGASARPEVASAIASAKKDVDEMTGYTRNMMNLEAVDGAGQGLERAGVTKGYDESNAVAHHLMGLPKPPEVDDAVWNAAGQKAATLTPEQTQTARESALEAMTGPHSAVHKFATYSGNTSGKWDPDINPELGGQDGYDAVAKEAAQHFINTQTKLGAGTAAAPAAAPAPAPEATAPAAPAAPAPRDDFQLTGAPKPPKAAPRYQRMSNRAAQGGAKLAGTGLVEGMSAPGTMSMLETSVNTGGSQIRAMKIPGADDDGTAKAVAYHVIGRQSWFDPEDDGPKAGITAEQWQRGQEIAAKMNPRQQNQVKNAVLKKLKEPGSELHYEASGDGTGDGKFDNGKHEIHREDGITNQAAYDAMIHHGALRWLNGRDG